MKKRKKKRKREMRRDREGERKEKEKKKWNKRVSAIRHIELKLERVRESDFRIDLKVDPIESREYT